MAYAHLHKFLRAVAMAIVFAWLLNNSKGSVLLAAVMHASVNATPRLYRLEFPETVTGFITNQEVLSLFALAGYASVALFLVLKPGALRNQLERGQESSSGQEPPNRFMASTT
jgi:hypothetical protein